MAWLCQPFQDEVQINCWQGKVQLSVSKRVRNVRRLCMY